MTSFLRVFTRTWWEKYSVRWFSAKVFTNRDSFYSYIADARGAEKRSGSGPISVASSPVTPGSSTSGISMSTMRFWCGMTFGMTFPVFISLDWSAKLATRRKKGFPACNYTTSSIQIRECLWCIRVSFCNQDNQCRYFTTLSHRCVCAGTSRFTSLFHV